MPFLELKHKCKKNMWKKKRVERCVQWSLCTPTGQSNGNANYAVTCVIHESPRLILSALS